MFQVSGKMYLKFIQLSISINLMYLNVIIWGRNATWVAHQISKFYVLMYLCPLSYLCVHCLFIVCECDCSSMWCCLINGTCGHIYSTISRTCLFSPPPPSRLQWNNSISRIIWDFPIFPFRDFKKKTIYLKRLIADTVFDREIRKYEDI